MRAILKAHLATEGKMRKLLLILSALLLGACAAHYSAADLAARNARFTEGTVVKQSLGSFILKDQAGKEILFHTGQLTQYIPEGYRSLKGDTVKVAYQEVSPSYGRVKRAVLQLQSLHVAAQNLPPSKPLCGKIVAIGRGSANHSVSILIKPADSDLAVPVYLFFNCKITLNSKPFFTGTADPEWRRLQGYSATVKLERIPVLRGNGYIFQTKSVVLTTSS